MRKLTYYIQQGVKLMQMVMLKLQVMQACMFQIVITHGRKFMSLLDCIH